MEKKLDEMNKFGFEAVDTYGEIYEFFQSEDYDGEKGANDYIQSIVNLKFSIAKVFVLFFIRKIYSKIHPINFEERIKHLQSSLEHYTFIRDFIKEKGKEKGQ
jgi:hypothetical protein